MKHSKYFLVKSVVAISLALLGLSVLLIITAPMILSTTVGKNWFEAIFNKFSNYTLSIEKIECTWNDKQKILGITAKAKDGSVEFSAPKITIKNSLLKILFTEKNLGRVAIKQPSILIHDKQTSSPIQNSDISARSSADLSSITANESQSPSKKTFTPSILYFSGIVEVKDAKITLEEGSSSVEFYDVGTNIEIKKESLSVNFVGQSKDQDIEGKFAGSLVWEPTSNITPFIDLKVTTEHFPITGIQKLSSRLGGNISNTAFSDLLGSSLNLQLFAKTAADTIKIKINASSETLDIKLETQSNEHSASLIQPAHCDLALKPSAINKLLDLYAPSSQWKVEDATKIHLEINSLTFPLKNKEANLLDLSCKGHIEASPFNIRLQNGESLNINSLGGSFSTSNLHESCDLLLQMETVYQNSSGTISYHGVFENLFEETLKGQMTLSAKNTPVAFLAPFILSYNPSLINSAIGEFLDLNAKINLTRKESHVEMDVKSPHLQIDKAEATINHSLTLKKPLTIKFHPTTPFLKNLNFGEDSQIKYVTPLEIAVDHLDIPLEDFSKLNTRFQVKSKEASFYKLAGISPFNFNDIQITTNVRGLGEIKVIAKESSFNVVATLKYDSKSHILSLTSPVDGDISISPSSPLKASFPFISAIDAPCEGKFSIQPFNMDFSSASLETAILEGTLSIQKLPLKSSSGESIYIGPIKAFFKEDKKADELNFSVSSKAALNKNEGSLHFETSLQEFRKGNYSFLDNPSKTSWDVKNFPLTILSSLNFLDAGIVEIVGPTINSLGNCTVKKDTSLYQFSLATSNASLEAKVKAKNGVFELQSASQPIKADLLLTPENFSSLLQIYNRDSLEKINLELKEPTKASFKVASLLLPLVFNQANQLQGLNFQEAVVHTSVSVDKLNLKEPSSSQVFSLNECAFSLQKDSGNAPLEVKFQSLVTPSSGKILGGFNSKEGEINFTGKIANLFNANGIFNPHDISSDLRIEIKQFPSTILELLSTSITSKVHPYHIFFGPFVNASLNLQLNKGSGPLNLYINSPTIRCALNGALESGNLKLKETFRTYLNLTPEFSSYILKRVNPLSLTAVTSLEPVQLTIEPNGFLLPLFQFDPGKISVANASLDLGKITCHNEGNISATLGFLKLTNLAKSRELTLWCAPMDFTVQQGVASIDRTEILIQDLYQIAVWGTYNFLSSYVDMVLGITGPCLEKAFGIGDLPKDYVIQVPMKGPADNVQVNSGVATAKIAALFVWQKKSIAEALAGKKGGQVLGGFLRAFANLPDGNAPTPPMKRPLPWNPNEEFEEEASDEIEENSDNDKENLAAASANKEPKVIVKQPKRKSAAKKMKKNPFKKILRVLQSEKTL